MLQSIEPKISNKEQDNRARYNVTDVIMLNLVANNTNLKHNIQIICK